MSGPYWLLIQHSTRPMRNNEYKILVKYNTNLRTYLRNKDNIEDISYQATVSNFL
jgi:hypothetical protein